MISERLLWSRSLDLGVVPGIEFLENAAEPLPSSEAVVISVVKHEARGTRHQAQKRCEVVREAACGGIDVRVGTSAEPLASPSAPLSALGSAGEAA